MKFFFLKIFPLQAEFFFFLSEQVSIYAEQSYLENY